MKEIKEYLVTWKCLTVRTCRVAATSADEAEQTAVDEYNDQDWSKEEVLCNDLETTVIRELKVKEYEVKRTGPINCEACGSKDVVAVDNQPLSTDRKWFDEYGLQMDSDLTMEFDCNRCGTNFTKTFQLIPA